MNDIQQIVTNFLHAAERLERLTVDINVMADQLEPALRGAGEVKNFEPAVNQMPTAAANYPAPPPAPAVNWQPTPPEMAAARDAAVAEIAQQAQVPQHVMAPPERPTAPVHPQAVADDFAPEPVAQQTPWDAQAAAPATTEEKPAKKGGRRTNEELAAELGVSLDDVKSWKGGGRISKADMEEFKRIHPDAVVAPAAAAPGQPSNPFGGAPQPAPAAPQQPYDNGGTLPAAAAPVAPPQSQGAPQEWPSVGQPVAAPTPAENPGEVYGDWPTVEGGFSPSNPFGG